VTFESYATYRDTSSASSGPRELIAPSGLPSDISDQVVMAILPLFGRYAAGSFTRPQRSRQKMGREERGCDAVQEYWRRARDSSRE